MRGLLFSPPLSEIRRGGVYKPIRDAGANVTTVSVPRVVVRMKYSNQSNYSILFTSFISVFIFYVILLLKMKHDTYISSFISA